jgi:outer membrane protein OmpA-like peptidoglycan-associated protein
VTQNLLTWDRGAIARVWPVDTDPNVPASGLLFHQAWAQDWLSKKGTSGPYTFVFELPTQAMVERLAFMAGRSQDTRARLVHAAFSVEGPDSGFSDAGTYTLQATETEQAFPLPHVMPARWIRVTIEPRPNGQTALQSIFAYGKEIARNTPPASLSGTWLVDFRPDQNVADAELLGPSGRLLAKITGLQHYLERHYGVLQIVQHGDNLSGASCLSFEKKVTESQPWRGTQSGNAVELRSLNLTGVANTERTLFSGRYGGGFFLAMTVSDRVLCLPPAVGNGKTVLVLGNDPEAYPPYAKPAKYPGYRFSSQRAGLLNDSVLADADSVVLAYLCDAGAQLADWQKSLLLDFIKAGHKLIIHSADLCTTTDFGFLPYLFSTSNPGARGARGERLIFVEPSSLGTDDRRDAAHFVNLTAYVGRQQDLGDANTVISQDEHWCGHLFGTNVLHTNGFNHMYARFGAGLIIYNGLDHDDGLDRNNPEYRRLLQLELAQPPSALLPCTQLVAARFLVAPSQTVPFVPGRAQSLKLHLEVLANQGYAGTVSLAPRPPDNLPWNLRLSISQVTLHGDIAPVDFTIDVPPAAKDNRYDLPVTGTDADGHTAGALITLVAKPPEQVQVVEEQGRLRIVLPAAILFDFDKSNLKPSAEAALAWAKGSIIDKYPGAHLIVEGHTDDRGTQAYNLKLGGERAQSVAAWLKGHGTPAALVETHSYGKTRPRYLPETTEENRTRNRRVEIIVVK